MGSFLQWNLQSYRTKFNDLKTLIQSFSPLCICIQETLLRDNAALPPSRYSIVQSPVTRMDDHERSTAVLVHNSLSYDVLALNTPLQACAVRLHMRRSTTVCSLYLPHLPISSCALDALIDQLPRPFLLLGDVNAKSPLWGSCNASTDARGAVFEQLLLRHDLVILNDGSATHFHIPTASYSAIDLSICSSDLVLDYTFSVVDDLHGSDHFPILLTPVTPVRPLDMPARFNYNKADWSLYEALTSVGAEHSLDESAGVDALLDYIEDVIMTAASTAIPLKGNSTKIPVPWFNDDCKLVKRERRRAQKAYQRRPTLFNRIAFLRCRARCRFIFEQTRKAQWRQYLSTINSRTSLHEIWKKVSKLSGKFVRTPHPVLRLGCGTLVSDTALVANELANSFSSVAGDHNYSPTFLSHKNRIEAQRLNFHSSHNFSYNEEIRMQELMSCLRTTSDSSPGIDRITFQLIKHLHPSFLAVVLHLFNVVFCRQMFPVRWKTAIVVPLPKPGKDPKIATNYRPISLTCCLCKLLEKIINHRLMWYLERGGHIVPAQSGFRRGRSTTDNLVSLESDLQNALFRRDHTVAVFFDLRKAYDTAWRRGILQNLFSYGLRGNLPIFVRNFLADRTLRVRIGDTLSDVFPLHEGVPQGSVLSCTCFLIAINSVATYIPANVSSSIYVDDIVIYASGKSTALLERRLQSAINSLVSWTKVSGLAFSGEKTVALHVCRKKNCPKISANLSLDGSVIRCVQSHKYLGVIFDSSLTWRPHIELLRRSCLKSLGLLKHLTHKSWGADRISLLRLFIMLVKPKIDYGVEAYSSACTSLLKSVDTLENAAIRIATGAYRSSPLLSLYAESGLKPPASYRDVKLLNYLLRIRAVPSHPLRETLLAVEARGDALVVPARIRDPPAPRSYFHRALSIQESYSLDFSYVMREIPAPHPPWRPPNVHVCEDLFNVKRSPLTSQELKNIFLAHRLLHVDSLHLYTDGSKTRDGVGYAYCSPTSHSSKRIQPEASIFSAELFAIYSCLTYAEGSVHDTVVIFSDSRSSILSLRQLYSPHPLVQLIQYRLALSSKSFTLCWVPSHVGVSYNERADMLAQSAISHPSLTRVLLPRGDHKAVLKSKVSHKWRERWLATPSNKYREISSVTRPLLHACCPQRAWSVCLTRLRIGHSHLTHSYLMENSHPPYCPDCLVPLTIKHILVECPSHIDVRQQFSIPVGTSMSNLLGGTLCAFGGPLYRMLLSLDLLTKL